MAREQLKYEDYTVGVPVISDKIRYRTVGGTTHGDEVYIRYKTSEMAKDGVHHIWKTVGKLLTKDSDRMYPNQRYFEIYMPEISNAIAKTNIADLGNKIDVLTATIDSLLDEIKFDSISGLEGLTNRKDIKYCNRVLSRCIRQLYSTLLEIEDFQDKIKEKM